MAFCIGGKQTTSLVVCKVISGGVLKPERVRVICPACGQQVEAVAWGGRVKGYCAVAKQHVDFLVEVQLPRSARIVTAEARAKLSVSIKKRWQDPEYRAKIVATHTGRHLSAETKAKISAVLKRRGHNKKAK